MYNIYKNRLINTLKDSQMVKILKGLDEQTGASMRSVRSGQNRRQLTALALTILRVQSNICKAIINTVLHDIASILKKSSVLTFWN